MNMYFVKTPGILKRLYGELMWSLETQENCIYLTFDDGPHPETTPELLSLLSENQATATFFCTGKQAEEHPELMKKIIGKGHATGNHGHDHLNGWKTATGKYVQDVIKANEFIHSPLFRPPYGRITSGQINRIRKQGYSIVMWDVLAGDFDARISKEQCAQNIIRHSVSGSVVVLHDNPGFIEKCLFALKSTLKHFGNMGYQFRAIPSELS